MVKFENPSIIRLIDYPELEDLEKALTYTSKPATYLYKNFKKNTWFANKYGMDSFNEKLEQLKNNQKICLLQEDDKGIFTYSGLINKVLVYSPTEVVERDFKYPELEAIPWHKVPDFKLWPHQETALEALFSNKHAAAELSVGSGKSNILLFACKRAGLKAVVVAPSVNIAQQLWLQFKTFLGAKYVGRYWGGKKESHKLITVAIDDSLVRVQKDSEHWANFQKVELLCIDEAHTQGAQSLKTIALDLFKNAPYRFFVSGTQTRNDGGELLLDGIIGPIAYDYSSRQAVADGFIAKPNFKIVKVNSASDYNRDNPLEMIKKHYYFNTELLNTASNIINEFILKHNKKVLVLIDEIEQFNRLLPLLQVKPHFAHGPLNQTQKAKLAKEYHSSDTAKLVEDFNNGLYTLLVGTSCISMGTDTRSPDVLVLLQSGKSEIKITQSVGRGLRKTPTKDKVTIIDFDVENVEMLHRHVIERIKIYNNIYPSVQYI